MTIRHTHAQTALAALAQRNRIKEVWCCCHLSTDDVEYIQVTKEAARRAILNHTLDQETDGRLNIREEDNNLYLN
jgi:hypothetical protein